MSVIRKAALDQWTRATGLSEGKIFRAVARLGKIWGRGISQNVVWYVVRTCCAKAGLEHIAPHDLRRTCAKLCHDRGGELEQIQFLLGHASVQTTEHYLGCEQNLGHPVNDLFDLGTESVQQMKHEGPFPANGAIRSVDIKRVVGPLAKFPTNDEAWAEVERLGLGRSFDENGPHNLEELADHFSKTELCEEQSENDWRASSTKKIYRLYLKNWIVPRWGSKPLDKIKAVAVEEWLRQTVKRAPGTKKKIRDVMHVLYTHAIRYEWTTRDPIALVRQSGKRRSPPELIAIEDLSKLIWEVLELRERAMVLLDFGGGLRRGELAGVKWEDIDFERRQVLPKRSIVSQVVGETKTEASSKPIPLDDSLLRELKLWRAETPYARDTDYVFASPKMKGKQPLWLDTLMRKVIKPVALNAGIQLKGWHTLRHTYSTMLNKKGNDPKVVQELLRHANLKTTMDTYTQALSPEKRKAHRGVIRMVVPRVVPRRAING